MKSRTLFRVCILSDYRWNHHPLIAVELAEKAIQPIFSHYREGKIPLGIKIKCIEKIIQYIQHHHDDAPSCSMQ
jgi:hypothetical protein